ncbi:D-2-hydroxyacid dehydrogenase, partial [Streptomyces sp. NPDC005921]
MTPPVPTLLVLDADPPPRLGRLTGRARIVRTDAAGLAARLPTADVLLVWDFAAPPASPCPRATTPCPRP